MLNERVPVIGIIIVIIHLLGDIVGENGWKEVQTEI